MILNDNHWILEDYRQRVTRKELQKFLLEEDGRLIFHGYLRKLKSKHIRAGIYEIYKEPKKEIMNDKNREMSEEEQCLNTNCKYYAVLADQNCAGAANSGTVAEFCKNWSDNKIPAMPEDLQEIIDDFNRPPAPYLPDTENAGMYADLAEHEKIRGDALAAAYQEKCKELEAIKKDLSDCMRKGWKSRYIRLLEVAEELNLQLSEMIQYERETTKDEDFREYMLPRVAAVKQFEELIEEAPHE